MDIITTVFMAHPVLYSVAIVLGLTVFLYRCTLPRLIPGNIPYDIDIAKKSFGHIPAIIKADNPLDFFHDITKRHDSPIIQVFLEPFGRAGVIITDARETHDILTRRAREFDRAVFFADLFSSLVPNNQVTQPTGEKWHAGRRLMADTMSPNFLANSAAPHAYAAFSTFTELWHLRAKLAKSRPFDGELDIDTAFLDSITAIAFGSSSHATSIQKEFVANTPTLDLDSVIDDQPIASFPRAAAPAEHEAMLRLAHSVQIPAQSPLGKYAHLFALTFFPKLRAARRVRKQVVQRQLRAAYEKFSNPEAGIEDVKSATDVIVQREVQMALKQGREPDLANPLIDDELFGFLVAGYDTTSTTVKWGVKYLSQYPDVQSKLRQELKSAFSDLAGSSFQPSIDHVLNKRPAYLDAVIEETLRLGNPGEAPMRTATVDTTIFGHFIPKGTDLILMSIGPGHTSPPRHVDESIRSKSSQETIDTAYTGNWDPTTLGAFRPERWLTQDANGNVTFNSRAGPQQSFGAGPRGCFGRKLAYVMMRIMFSLIVWNFELLPIDGKLGDFTAVIVMTNKPKDCYVKLRSLREE